MMFDYKNKIVFIFFILILLVGVSHSQEENVKAPPELGRGLEIKKQNEISPVSDTNVVKSLIEEGNKNYEIQDDLPNYYTTIERVNIKMVFSGRDIRIIKSNGNKIEVTSDILLVKRDKENYNIISYVNLLSKKHRENFFVIRIDEKAETGFYTIEFFDGNKQIVISVGVEGLPKVKKKAKFFAEKSKEVEKILRLGCGYCFWEMVFKISPIDENYGYFIGGGAADYLVQTKDKWQTFSINRVNERASPLLKYFRGDPKLSFMPDGRLLIASLFEKDNEPITGGYYTEKNFSSYPVDLEQTILSEIPDNLPASEWIIFDYPKIAVDNFKNSPFYGSIYVSSNNEKTFYIIRNGNIDVKDSLSLLPNKEYFQPPNSLIVGKDGIIYGSSLWADSYGPWLYKSIDGGNSFVKRTISEIGNGCFHHRIKEGNDRYWFAYQGPELAEDKNGRLYAVWSDITEDCEYKKVFNEIYNFTEIYMFNDNSDIYLSYSDDKGETWSVPVRVNEGAEGDDLFPSIAVDEQNNIFVAFIKHLIKGENAAKFDVYIAQSSNRGATFSKNIKVNDISIPNEVGGRAIGDYLDMVDVGKENVYVAYPCVNKNAIGNNVILSNPNDVCVSVIKKPLVIEEQIEVVKKESKIGESFIVNNVDYDINGHLELKLEEYNGGAWSLYQRVYNNRNIYISRGSKIDLSRKWNIESVGDENRNNRLLEKGLYRIKASFTFKDKEGKEVNLEKTLEFDVV